MFSAFKKNSIPKGYPTFDQMCAYFYVAARTHAVPLPRIIIESRNLNDLYYRNAVYHKQKNPLKNIKAKFTAKKDYFNCDYFRHDTFAGINLSSAIEEALSCVDGTAAIENVFEHMDDHHYNRCKTASLAAGIVEELGGASHLQSSADGSYVTGVVIDDIDTNKLKEPRFNLVSRSDYTPQDISQFIQCFMTGVAELTKEKLETVDAVRHAKSQSAKISNAIGGNEINQIEYQDLDTGKEIPPGLKPNDILQIGK